MKYLISALVLVILLSVPVRADDNTANCELVVQQLVDPDTEDKSVQVVTFMPAGEFIFSVFGAKQHMTEVEGKPIRAVMCTRTSVVPSEFDLELIRTGIPFYLSPDFDSQDSAFLGMRKTEDGYAYSYAGPDLLAGEIYLLKLRMKVLNNAED